ncbi:MAG TPA: HAD-IB family phosphatase [Armatimonadota bacterium]|jgi:2,3-diketo-5-methylthio-1-phosphopentane phosphatase
MNQHHPPSVLITDFDGTVTQQDFYRIALAELVPPGTPDYWDDFLAGRITHFQALQQIFTHIHADEDTVMTVARRMGVDPAFAPAVARLRAAGWEVVVASAGCTWYVSRLLAEQGVSVPIYANPGDLLPGDGLQMRLPVDSPYYSANTGIDKEAVVRAAKKNFSQVAFAGDGRPDAPAALLVPPEMRFARGWLADHFRQEGIPFQPFSCWTQIAQLLLRGLV